jgi:hypothetical protein
MLLFPWILIAQENLKVIDYNEAKSMNIPAEYVNANGKVLIEKDYYEQLKSAELVLEEPDEIDGWPIGAIQGTAARANRSYDLDGDGSLELIIAAQYYLYVFGIDGNLWDGFPVMMNYEAGGTPAIGNVDDDPEPEIIVSCNFAGLEGQLNVFNIDGSMQAGFPITYDYGAPMNDPLLENIDGDPEYEIIVSVRDWPYGHVFAYNGDASIDPYWENVTLDYIPGAGVSSGDLNDDGTPEIIACSYWAIHVFDIKGNYLPGWPFVLEQDVRGISYSNPVIADIDEDGLNEIVLGTVNEQPQTDAGAVYVLNGDGTLVNGWPQYVLNWIFSPVVVADLDQDGHLDIVVGDNVLSPYPDDYLMAYDKDGNFLPGFPRGELPAMTAQPSVADIDGDMDYEILYDNNMYENPYQIFHHDGSEFDAFELDPGYGIFYNSLLTRDLNGDGNLNIMLSTNDFNNNECYHHIYDLNIPYNPDYIAIETHQYNSRNTGEYGVEDVIIGIEEQLVENNNISVYPNPISNHFYIEGLNFEGLAQFTLYNALGEIVFSNQINVSSHTRIDLNEHLPSGLYLYKLSAGNQIIANGKVTR